MSGTDIIDLAAGLPAHSPVAALRRQRPDFVRHGQGSHDVLIAPADPAGVSLIERAAAALRVAVIEHDAALAVYYRGRLRDIGADTSTIAAAEQGREANAISPRFDAIQRHVIVVSVRDRRAMATFSPSLFARSASWPAFHPRRTRSSARIRSAFAVAPSDRSLPP